MFHNNYTQQEYKSYHIILPANTEAHTGQLILGDLNAATDQELMREHKVKTIITAATGLQHLKIPSQLTHVVFPLLDLKTQNIQSYFELSYQTIEQNLKRGSVLVHCGAGISRSATLVIAYYMKKYKSAFNPAIKFVRNCRPNICPNLGFQLQLKNYQQILEKNQQQTKPFKQQINSDNNKKKLIQAKQMLLTFNAPDKQIKSQRMTNTSKNFSTYTPNVPRKTPNYSNNKRNKQETDLLVVGHNTEGRNESVWQEVSWNKGSSGIRRGKNNYSYKM